MHEFMVDSMYFWKTVVHGSVPCAHAGILHGKIHKQQALDQGMNILFSGEWLKFFDITVMRGEICNLLATILELGERNQLIHGRTRQLAKSSSPWVVIVS